MGFLQSTNDNYVEKAGSACKGLKGYVVTLVQYEDLIVEKAGSACKGLKTTKNL